MGSKLEELGKQFRKENIVKNTYQNAQGNEYGQKHPNALSDGDKKGKGTGNFLDTYNGGSVVDEVGSANEPGSGRIANVAKNEYSAEKPYGYPDTEDNKDQFRVS
tara:strand:- start:152 stop:466 length:315 start_codon:yes stop_codon:yes gene_type:complete